MQKGYQHTQSKSEVLRVNDCDPHWSNASVKDHTLQGATHVEIDSKRTGSPVVNPTGQLSLPLELYVRSYR